MSDQALMTTVVGAPDRSAALDSTTPSSRRRVSFPAPGLIALIVVALALRFYRLGHQGIWFDEAYTVMLVKLPFATMLSRIKQTESTPYVYYVLIWIWSHVFGRGASDLRSLSALCGTAVVPVAYLAGEKLLRSRRAAMIAAALVTFNPLLIWYSQEARAYELLVLSSALSLLGFAYVCERRSWRRVCAWAIAAGLALGTHYYAALIVLPEAIWLIGRHRRDAGIWLAVAFVAACGGGLMPLLIAQDNSQNAAWIEVAALGGRLAQILPQFLIGTGSYAYRGLMWAGFVLAASGLALTGWEVAASGATQRRERLRPLGPAALAVGGFALAMIVVACGTDNLLTRNLLPLWLPAALAVAAGLGSRRAGRAGIAVAAAICALGLTATVSVLTDYALQRPDWPAVARALGPWRTDRGVPADARRLIVFQENPWLESLTEVYLTDAQYLPRTGHHRDHARDVREIDVVANTASRQALKHWLCWWGAGCNLYPSKLRRSYSFPGFREVGLIHVKQFSIMRLVSSAPQTIDRQELVHALGRLNLYQSRILIQRSAAG